MNKSKINKEWKENIKDELNKNKDNINYNNLSNIINKATKKYIGKNN